MCNKKYRFIHFICMMLIVQLFSVSMDVDAAEITPSKGAVYIDGKPIKTEYVLQEEHLYVPAIFFKQTGVYVDYNQKFNSLVFQNDAQMSALPIGMKRIDQFSRKTGIWTSKQISLSSITVKNKQYVPFGIIAKELGMDVHYDDRSKRTYVTTNIDVKANQTSNGNRQYKFVALTFDDGPDTEYTSRILAILEEKNVRATFFLTGKNIAKYPQQVKRIIEAGHAVGNHSYNHPDFTKQWSQQVIDEIQSTQAEFLKVIGKKPDLLRPPYGALTKADRKILNELGLRNILWSVDTLDWEGKSAEEILATVHKQIFPGGIILQHNFAGKKGELEGSVEALPQIIDELRAEGYTFLTVQSLLEQK